LRVSESGDHDALNISFRVPGTDTGFGPDQARIPAAAVGRPRQIQDEIKAGKFFVARANRVNWS
jgi:hypothetical protein